MQRQADFPTQEHLLQQLPLLDFLVQILLPVGSQIQEQLQQPQELVYFLQQVLVLHLLLDFRQLTLLLHQQHLHP